MGFLNTFRKLCPVEVGPWWTARKYVHDKMKELNVQSGDIICRKGNAFIYGYFPMSEFICYLTESKYSHAALVIDSSEDIMIADVNTSGLRRQFAIDWCDDVRGEDILILRYEGENYDLVTKLAVENAKSVLRLDPKHDEDFLHSNDGKCFYCVCLLVWCYLRAGVRLCEDVKIKDLPKWKKWTSLLARLHGVNPDATVWFVGNEKVGLMSSPNLKVVGTIPFPSHLVKKCSSSIIRGA